MAEDEIKEYSYELQKLFLEFLISSRDLAARCNNVLDPEYFDRRLRPAAKFIKEYITEHSNVPDAKQLSAVTTIEIQEIGDKAEEHKDWFLDEFEGFSRHKALEGAILNSADLYFYFNFIVDKFITKITKKALRAIFYIIECSIDVKGAFCFVYAILLFNFRFKNYWICFTFNF